MERAPSLSRRRRDKHNTQNRVKVRSNRDTKSENGQKKARRPAGPLWRWGALIDSPVGGIAAWEVDRARPPAPPESTACGNRTNWAPRIDSASGWFGGYGASPGSREGGEPRARMLGGSNSLAVLLANEGRYVYLPF